MSKCVAKLLIHSIENNKLDIIKSDNEKVKILEELKMFPVRTAKRIIKNHNITHNMLEIICEDLYSKYSEFIIFGCPMSTDLDVVCVVDNVYQENGKCYPLLSSEIERLKSELFQMNFSEEKMSNIDINIISIKDKSIIAVNKGGKEIGNIILSTYEYHKQKHSCPEIDFIEINIFNKLRSISKFIIDHLEIITNTLTNFNIKQIRKQSYQQSETMNEMFYYSRQIRSVLDTQNINNSSKWKDDMKSFTMKICQLILLKNNVYEYTKFGIYEKLKNMSVSECHGMNNYSGSIFWLLTRGKYNENKEGKIEILNMSDIMSDTISDTILKMYDIFVDIFSEYENSIIKINKSININVDEDNFKSISGNYYFTFKKILSFFQSPNKLTNEFEIEWNNNFENNSVNANFELFSTIPEMRIELLSKFEISDWDKFIWTNQRSNEWLKLLKYYTCGNNSKEISKNFESKFNLIRGAVAEILICQNLIFENFTKIQLGLIVRDIFEKSIGCAPDLLLVNENEIIPVEIKCLKTGAKNSDYYDSFCLAEKQCDSVKKIIDNIKKNLILRKMIILSWFNDVDKALNYEINLLNY